MAWSDAARRAAAEARRRIGRGSTDPRKRVFDDTPKGARKALYAVRPDLRKRFSRGAQFMANAARGHWTAYDRLGHQAQIRLVGQASGWQANEVKFKKGR